MPQWLADALTQYGYFALFAGVFLENLGIPVPGETVLLAAGFFSREHMLRIELVIPSAIVAAILGDNFGYWIGRSRGRAFAERHRRLAKHLHAVDEHFKRHGARTIFFARFVTGLRVVAAISAGISRIRWRVFFAFNAAGAIVWATAIGLLGWAFGQSWRTLEHWVGRTGLIVVIAVVVGAALALRIRHHRAASKNGRPDRHGKR